MSALLSDTSSRTGARRGLTYFWPVLGAASLLLACYSLGRWLAGGVSSVPPGDDPMPTAQLVLMHALEWIQFAAFLAIVGWVVVRPLIQRRPLGFDGLFVIAAFLLNFWDVMDNYWSFSFQYNAHHLNVGSWGGYIPGWQSPQPELWSVPIGFVFGAYTWAFFLAVRSGCALLTYLQNRYPTWGPLRAFGVVFVSNMFIEAISENVYLRIGAIANIRPYEALTLWDGTQHAWPVYNPILFSLVWTALTAFRWYRDKDGLTFVERGLPATRGGQQPSTILRFFAIFAFLEVTYLLLYFLPWNLFAAMRTAPPNVFPSYFPVP
ncbi:spirocyclase AveC family protein [Mycobacterium barrassiae]|uniref:spirocyclase AveC family protein n=1 Tax=Mycobacterium barrassiae TaxID=319709 RepID=UPI002265C076|nr:spirocyclase AveC family protein [Mycobacterium barrassiae]MCV7298334.1 spirocyclase AveC family protein [Mycobacterium barrassiae]